MSAPGTAAALVAARERLLSARVPAGHWEGELSPSALSTATAVMALALGGGGEDAARVRDGLAWLAGHANMDGGWGDTTLSASNIATTLLARCAFAAAGAEADHVDAVSRADAWVAGHAGDTSPAAVTAAVERRYGNDRTFSAPILAVCAITGRLGPAGEAWPRVAQLPFELAVLPQRLFKWLRLPVVSYALPALIAIGQVRHHHRPTRNPAARLLRALTARRARTVLRRIQPASGGFIEAVPLTSFVAISLAAMGQGDHPVVRHGLAFLRTLARPDGSWPIDTNLATWVTTLAVGALAAAGGEPLPREEAERVRRWLLAQQFRQPHPYTGAAPGGWAWTDRPGGVPDGDDTPGALLALRRLGPPDDATRDAAAAGVRWLLDLQNADGGIPTFCRGWGTMPFDRSAPDLTAHALLAWRVWGDALPPALETCVRQAARRAVAFLAGAQREDGAWLPLWFGNEGAPGEESPVYGTARVLLALAGMAGEDADAAGMVERGTRWLREAQAADGGWGGAPGVAPTIEETALAVDALAATGAAADGEAARRGAAWLAAHTKGGTKFPAAPIGLYFARLWYAERLYPLVFTVSALSRLSKANIEHRTSNIEL
jgi:squalene-hopene/tetraprenyl-beta-curcumene cyclase